MQEQNSAQVPREETADYASIGEGSEEVVARSSVD